MVTKISIAFLPSKVWDNSGLNKIEFAQTDIALISEKLRVASRIAGYLTQFPEHDIIKAIGIHTTEKPRTTNYGKKKRVHSIEYLFITEVDL